LCLRGPRGIADQCSHACRTVIDKWARKIRSVALRESVGVIEIDKPTRREEVGDADRRGAANEPARFREVLGRAGLIDNRAINQSKTDQAVQLGSRLRKARAGSGVNIALTESAANEWDEIEFLRKACLGGAHIGRPLKGTGAGCSVVM
jgi:hypothetical protein